jgi:hypothetical protein
LSADTGAITFSGNEIQGNPFGGTGTLITKTVDNAGNNYSTGSGSLGFLNFGSDGTIQNVKAGWTVTFASGATRAVSQDAYQPLGTYWNIGFDSAYVWSAGDVMPVTFSSPDYVAGTNSQVTLAAGTESWTFGTDGNLTLPGNTFAVNYANGAPVSIPVQVTDSWTLTVGTNTVSFTLPEPGAYSIWVNGNIPNGIVTYTATIVLSNSNVPVVGSSYGWYYDLGGTEALALTAIPTQVVGTVNTISTATLSTTTANVFTFGITNNTVSSQVVDWGYTKL